MDNFADWTTFLGEKVNFRGEKDAKRRTWRGGGKRATVSSPAPPPPKNKWRNQRESFCFCQNLSSPLAFFLPKQMLQILMQKKVFNLLGVCALGGERQDDSFKLKDGFDGGTNWE